MKNLSLPARVAVALSLLGGLGATLNVCAQPSGGSSPLLPDHTMTPGATLPVTARDICVSGYTKKVRNVPEAVKKQVYAEYGIARRKPGEYEVDHLISLELGGSNSIKNLWPESYVTQPWNAHVKDKLENYLHAEVCNGHIALADAQKEISGDWIASYKARFHTSMPLAQGTSRRRGGTRTSRSASATPPPPRRRGLFGIFGRKKTVKASAVWVNTDSGVYWRPGTRYYQQTKRGKLMTESDALKAGYHAAKGE